MIFLNSAISIRCPFVYAHFANDKYSFAVAHVCVPFLPMSWPYIHVMHPPAPTHITQCKAFTFMVVTHSVFISFAIFQLFFSCFRKFEFVFSFNFLFYCAREWCDFSYLRLPYHRFLSFSLRNHFFFSIPSLSHLVLFLLFSPLILSSFRLWGRKHRCKDPTKVDLFHFTLVLFSLFVTTCSSVFSQTGELLFSILPLLCLIIVLLICQTRYLQLASLSILLLRCRFDVSTHLHFSNGNHLSFGKRCKWY